MGFLKDIYNRVFLGNIKFLNLKDLESPIAGLVIDKDGNLGTGISGQGISLNELELKLSNKVDKENGKSLTTNDFTNEYQNKLDNIEDPLFLGRFPTISQLEETYPEGKSGQYAYVEAIDGENNPIVYTYQWVVLASAWEIIQGVGTEETPLSIKQKYESNPNTNAFTDSHQEDLNVAYNHSGLIGNPHALTAADLNLDKVNNTSDIEKPVSAAQAAAIFQREPLITPSTIDHYYRGDKSWHNLDKIAVGLSNVNNTSDAEKPVSQATINALGVKADLVNGIVPTSQLPSYVDNVQEYPNLTSFPQTGMSNVVYLSIDTNKPYRWGGSSYIEISSSGVALGETASTAYRGDRGKIAYDHSLTQNNPHNVTKAQVGLPNVDNTSDMNKPVSNAVLNALNSKVNFPSVDKTIPVRGENGQQSSILYDNAATVGSFPQRDSTGNFHLGEPQEDSHAATKGYVDAIINESGGIGAGTSYIDANGWRVYDLGFMKIATKTKAFNTGNFMPNANSNMFINSSVNNSPVGYAEAQAKFTMAVPTMDALNGMDIRVAIIEPGNLTPTSQFVAKNLAGYTTSRQGKIHYTVFMYNN